MANCKKFSDMNDIARICKHYERSVKNDRYGNADIDVSKLDADRQSNLAPDRGNQVAYIRKMIKKIMGDRTLRRDAVKLCCWVVQCPQGLPADRKKDFFQEKLIFFTN